MIKINSVNSVNNYTPTNKTSFKANNATNPQTQELQEVRPDFAVKTPMNYSKTGEINFPYDTKAHLYKLANGQKIIIIPQDGETVLRTYVNTGSMNEPDNIRGISHYIEHNLFNGSEGLEEGDFFNQVNKMGASTNASTGFAETNYYISSNLLNKTDLENKIKLHASMLETPLFATSKLEKEKSIVNSEINMITSNPLNLAINKMLKNLYGINTNSTDMIGGTTDNINALTREDVVNYFNTNYYPANMVTVINGDVNPDDTIKLVSKYFTSKKQPQNKQYFENLTPIENSIREDIISDKATATSIVIGFNGPSSENTRERIFSEALMTLLVNSPAARINKEIKKFNTAAIANEEKISTRPQDGRALMFVAEGTEENSEKILKSIFNEIGNIANKPPTEKEMQIIKKNMLKSFSFMFENSFATNNAVGTSILENNKDYLNNFEKIVNSMTADDIVNTARKYFDTNKSSVTVIHPSSATKESINQNYTNLSFTGARKQPVNSNNIKEYNAANNYRIITQNSKTNNVDISYKISIDKDFIVKPAAAVLLNELLNEGTATKKQEDFDSDLANEGIIKDFYASEKEINCSVNCDSETITKGFDTIKEVLGNPAFDEDRLKQVKDIIRDSILTSEKSAYDKLKSELYSGLPKGWSKEEILESLDGTTLEDIKVLYNYILSNGKGVIAVSAPFEKNKNLKDTVFSNISTFKKVKSYTNQKINDVYRPVENTKVLTDTDSKNQAEIIQAYKFRINENIKDVITLQLLNIILGGTPSSRLFMDLRENKKLAYHVKSNIKSNNNIGVISLRISTTTENKDTGELSCENVQKSIEGFKHHIELIKNEKVTEDELNSAKLNLKNQIFNCNNDTLARNNGLIENADSIYGALKDNIAFNEIDKITIDDIYNAANYIFSGKPLYSIVASENTIKANEEYLKTLQ